MTKISFKLPKYSIANIKLVGQVKKGLVAIDPILSQIQIHSVSHGGSMRQVSKPVILETTMQKHSVTINLEKECFLKTDSSIFGNFLFGLCDSFISEQKKYLFEVVFKVTEATGNVFDVQGRNIWDAMLEMVRNMPMCFDEEGNHNYQLYINSETGKKLKEYPPTPEQEKAMEELIKSKEKSIMLRNVLEDYLNSIIERDFDFPIMSLLQTMGFYDIHFTHGRNEIGKDFIAKKLENNVVSQYAIQSKRGDINQSELDKIQGQLLLASISGLSHPQFNKNLQRQVILVTTGRLTGNAPIILQDFNTELVNTYQKNEIIFWGKEQIIQFSEEFGLTGIYQNTAKGLKGFAQFYLVYSKAIEGNLSDREIEEFSRLWLDEGLDYKKRILRASIETEIIVSKLLENGFLYEAITVYLSLARTVLQTTYENNDEFIKMIYEEIVNEKILPLCEYFFEQFKLEWETAENSLLNLCFKENSLPMLQYIVWCARVLETGSLHYFLSKDKDSKNKIVEFLIEFIDKEEGCGHIPSDRYAVCMVWITLVLIQANKVDEAIALVKKCVVWMCDRVENGFGLAHYEADEYEETVALLGYPFEFIKVEKNSSPFLATVLSDLAAFVGNKQFYEDIFNDIQACEIVYSYWQFPDTKAIFTIDSEECLAYGNNALFSESINSFEDYDYATHIKDESKSFQIVDKVGKESLILLSILLKDRYFPTIWKKILSN